MWSPAAASPGSQAGAFKNVDEDLDKTSEELNELENKEELLELEDAGRPPFFKGQFWGTGVKN